jgi:signal transduction histidine kinase
VQLPQSAANQRPRERTSCTVSIEALQNPAMVLDRGLRVKTANRAFYTHFKVTRAETEGNVLFEIGNREWSNPKLHDLLTGLNSGEHSFRDIEWVQQIPPLGERVLLLSAQRLRDERSDEELNILVIEDATERRRAENSLRTACAGVESQARELRRSNEELRQFAEIASHDLRAPLHAVLQYTQLLEQQCKNKIDEEDFSNFEKINQTVRGMADLITDLLSYAQVLGSSSDAPALVDAQAVLQTALTNLHASLVETEATVTWASLPKVHVHSTQLLQLLQNLIGNAIQYRNGLRPQIHVSAARREDCWVFAVRDNGIGIKAQDCDRIFEPFRRLHGNERPGTGLGLSVCKKIVEQRGGRIWVTSEVDKRIDFLLCACGRNSADLPLASLPSLLYRKCAAFRSRSIKENSSV